MPMHGRDPAGRVGRADLRHERRRSPVDQVEDDDVKNAVSNGFSESSISSSILRRRIPQVKQRVAVRKAKAVLAGPGRGADVLLQQPGRRVQDVPPVVLGDGGGAKQGDETVSQRISHVVRAVLGQGQVQDAEQGARGVRDNSFIT